MNKHTATHEGFTFTRNSANRTYTHVVLVKGSVAADRITCEEVTRSMYRQNRAHYQAILDGTSRFLERPSYVTEERHAARVEYLVAHAHENMDGGEEGQVAKSLARFDERAKGRKVAADGDTYYSVVGWCGRHDLAAKEASRSGGFAVACTMTTTGKR